MDSHFRPGSQEENVGRVDSRILRLATKQDLGSETPAEADLAISAKTGLGLDALLETIAARAADAMGAGDDAVLTRERHRRVLTDALACLERAAAMGQDAAIELLAEDLRLALRALGRMTGAVDVEEVLDRIFASFCIGK